MKQVYNCCRECGALFAAAIPLAYCNKHKHLDDEQFSIVEDYVIHHPMCNALQVNSGTGIQLSELLRYINEGRLSTVGGQITVRKEVDV